MKRFVLLLVIVVVVGGAVRCSGGEPLTREVAAPVVEGNSRFALELYGRLVKHGKTAEGQGNLFFSPYSISTALAMTWSGAGGQTERDMAETMHFEVDQEHLHSMLGAIERRLNQQGAEGGYQLSVANALWGQQGEPFLPEFLDVVKKCYGGGLNQVDFVRQTEAARVKINKWVEDKTQEKIKDLISPGVLDRTTVLVLTNAIYFKGDWASQFDKKRTREQAFRVSADKNVTAPLMYQKDRFGYGKVGDVQVLELPYKGDDLSMVILLPGDVDGLAAMEKSLTAEKMTEMLGRIRKMKVEVYLPRFKMEWGSGSLKNDLKAMGMGIAFGNRADFSGMNGKRDLFISDVVHKAFVEVNEQGTEAAAATGVVMGRMSVQMDPVFRADHPFMFVIRDNKLGSILFMGRVVNPVRGGE